MEGIVLKKNGDMTSLAKNLCFEQHAIADDPDLLQLRLRL
jgi:hypothetical protein